MPRDTLDTEGPNMCAGGQPTELAKVTEFASDAIER